MATKTYNRNKTKRRKARQAAVRAHISPSSNGRTTDFDSANCGSNPQGEAKTKIDRRI